MLLLDEQNVSVPSNLDILPPVLLEFLNFKLPFILHNVMGKALD